MPASSRPLLRLAAVTAVAVPVLLTAGCGNDLTGSSTCADFMNAQPDQQDQVVNTLATKYGKPDFTTPLGRPDVNYECAQRPSMTLDQFFSSAQG